MNIIGVLRDTTNPKRIVEAILNQLSFSYRATDWQEYREVKIAHGAYQLSPQRHSRAYMSATSKQLLALGDAVPFAMWAIDACH